jgi:hypothetical protein
MSPQLQKDTCCGFEDEACELDSDGSTRSDSNASSRNASTKQTLLKTPTLSLPAMRLDHSDIDSETDEESEEEIKAPPARGTFGYPSPQKPVPTTAQLLAKLPPPEAAPKGLNGLVSYLRQENKLLREALIRLQHEAEDVSSKHAQGDIQNVDFAHLLELAREFGDLCTSQEVAGKGETDAACNFSISTPRGENHLISVEDTESKIRSDLEFSRREVARLEALVAEREVSREIVHSCSSSEAELAV